MNWNNLITCNSLKFEHLFEPNEKAQFFSLKYFIVKHLKWLFVLIFTEQMVFCTENESFNGHSEKMTELQPIFLRVSLSTFYRRKFDLWSSGGDMLLSEESKKIWSSFAIFKN